MKREFSQHVFEKYSNIKFHENPPSESRIVPGGLTGGATDRNDKGNDRSSQICELA
jgi:hypothetical protein